jgi:hypothetical protein
VYPLNCSVARSPAHQASVVVVAATLVNLLRMTRKNRLLYHVRHLEPIL